MFFQRKGCVLPDVRPNCQLVTLCTRQLNLTEWVDAKVWNQAISPAVADGDFWSRWGIIHLTAFHKSIRRAWKYGRATSKTGCCCCCRRGCDCDCQHHTMFFSSVASFSPWPSVSAPSCLKSRTHAKFWPQKKKTQNTRCFFHCMNILFYYGDDHKHSQYKMQQNRCLKPK